MFQECSFLVKKYFLFLPKTYFLIPLRITDVCSNERCCCPSARKMDEYFFAYHSEE
jgi:hypothetical protein